MHQHCVILTTVVAELAFNASKTLSGLTRNTPTDVMSGHCRKWQGSVQGLGGWMAIIQLVFRLICRTSALFYNHLSYTSMGQDACKLAW